MAVALIVFLQILPVHESMVYETNDQGKIGRINVISHLDSTGYNIVYTSDRIIEIRLDSGDLSTLYAKKTVKGNTELIIVRDDGFDVHFKGRHYQYHDKRPIYDRHTLDFALRGFKYGPGYHHRFRLHIPEFMIVNADLEVERDTTVETPVGVFKCWMVKMKPRIFFLNKKFYFFIEQDFPHRFVKYTDPSGENSIVLRNYETVLQPNR
jgi:hypothetical protein